MAETNPETPPEPPPQPNLYQPHQAPPFTVQLFMWTFPLEQTLEEHMRTRLDTSQAVLKVARSVMYSDAGFDVSKCGRYLALCELDPQVNASRAGGMVAVCMVVQLLISARPSMPSPSALSLSLTS